MTAPIQPISRAAVRPCTVEELTKNVTMTLSSGAFRDPQREAALLIAAVSERSLGELEVDRLLGRELPAKVVERILVAAERRARHEPLQHITGRAPFRDFELAVGSGVFVPRPETEMLVEFVLSNLPVAGQTMDASSTVVDIGAGSGTVAISVARARNDLNVVALEASPFAWPWLQRNVRELAPQVDSRFGDWQAQLPAGNFLALCSNPPYVPAASFPADPEVRLFDPDMALYSGEDGLDEIRRIARAGAERLVGGGFVVVEHTEEQGEAIRAIFDTAGLVAARTEHDLTGRPRFTAAWQPKSR